ncbi:MAG: undecaprenyldiphospho-muramoylpentapeptide beta-N-acetylglucosaminyltransferase [Sphingobium sp.]
MSVARHYVLAAGGTGGHLMPAHAVAEELTARGHQVALITDERGAKIPGIFGSSQTHILPPGRPAGGLVGWVKGLRGIWAGRSMSRRVYRKFRPSVVVGFGGYPALPALLAAFAEGVPTIVHDQNAVLGRVNRLVAGRVNAIATAYPEVMKLADKHAGKVHLIGNPVRDNVLALREQPFPAYAPGDPVHVLVTGGSQGATILSQVVPAAVKLLPEALRARLRIVQQCRPEDLDGVRAAYAALGMVAELSTFIENFPARLAQAQIVIARAGASTIAELTVAGRPAILVPLPSAMDDHQTYNAREMERNGGAVSIAQPDFTPEELARHMQILATTPDALETAASRARECGLPNAVKDMADLIESIGVAPIKNDVVKVVPVKPAAGIRGVPA